MMKLKKEIIHREFTEKNYPLEGFIDTHIHTSPDIKTRLCTDIEAAVNAKKERMNSIVLKSHYEPTSGRAIIASEVTDFPVYGGVVLNNSVGGLNVDAVKSSAMIGGKFVWFPTISYPSTQINWSHVEDILHVVKENEMIIATGHLKSEDIFTLIDMANGLGIWRIIVNHPLTKVVDASLDEQVEMSAYAYLEHCYVACMEKHDKLDPVLIKDSIKKVGANRCLMATDFGQIHNPSPVNGMKSFINSMIEEGVSLDEIYLMCKYNPHKLIN
ncbi:MAG: DUF6282 family protein [Methanobacterium sp.]|uniref:DUF6282 family protein n=1 Tax=Methanobacterium sp. TaxID=2164 RepID=UPI003C776BC6